jgi:hypothetical protein
MAAPYTVKNFRRDKSPSNTYFGIPVFKNSVYLRAYSAL